ncbi:restriction endonuclease [Amycolatopsis sp. NPDC088138]|uniref:restriction endonuclease n=1 Tax=Amycolatopsis sp. NPDC088138 TaxID=3363938 RepID=UPI00382CCD70
MIDGVVTSAARNLRMTETLRYASGVSTIDPRIDGLPNFHHLTVSADGTRISLASGINLTREVVVDGQVRRPVLALRSSPWKAGQESTPWHDTYDLDHGYVRYFGDHKAGSPIGLGKTRGNAALLASWPDHRGATADERRRATPIVLFRSVTVSNRVKGHVQFCGLAVIERLEHVIQRDPTSGQSFANYVFDLAVLNLAPENELLDWRWIDDRRDPTLSTSETLRHSPTAWRDWIEQGDPALSRIRRRVAASQVRSGADQRPVPGSAEADVLDTIYRHFDGKKVQFELLAARVAGSVFRGRGSAYTEGWLTRGSGDGGTDFVGRLDVGAGEAVVPLVVLGQAKCVLPSTSISAEQIARVVARLRRGWIGAYVTTGVYSRAAQEEIIDDQYPILLIDGRKLAEEVRRMAFDSHGGDVSALLADIEHDYLGAVSSRRPEEVLHL